MTVPPAEKMPWSAIASAPVSSDAVSSLPAAVLLHPASRESDRVPASASAISLRLVFV